MSYFKDKSTKRWFQIALTAFFIGVILIIWVFVSAENANAQFEGGESKLTVTAADTSKWFDLSLGNSEGILQTQLIILNVSAAATESLQVIVMHSNEKGLVDRKNHEEILGYFSMVYNVDSTYITGAGCVGSSYWFYAPANGIIVIHKVASDSTYHIQYPKQEVPYAGQFVRFIATPTGGTWTFRYEVRTLK